MQRSPTVRGDAQNPAPALGELLTVKTVAQRLSLSPRQVWRLTRAGTIPQPVRLASSVRWRSADIEQWIIGGCRPVEGRTR